MSLKLQTLQFDPAKGHDTLVSVGTIDFDPTSVKTKDEAAKGLHKALSAYAKEAGYGADSVKLWNPDEANSRGYGPYWMVSWEEGPFEWAINLSFKLAGAWGYTEPYYSFDLIFVE